MTKSNTKLKLVALVATLFLFCSAIEQLPYGQTQIEGKFIIQSVNAITPSRLYTVNIEKNSIFIKGCNSLSSTFTYDLATQAFKANLFTSTRIFCEGDQDPLVTQALTQARKAHRDNNVVIFEDAQGKDLLILATEGRAGPELSDPVQVSPPQPVKVNIQGKYDLILPPLELAINGSSFSLRGCNNLNFKATFGYGDAVTFGSGISTLKACPIDFDRFYAEAFKQGRFFVKAGNGFRLLDENKRLLLEIAAQPGVKTFLVSVPSVDLTIDHDSFNYEGCNIQTTSYTIPQTGKIQFGQTASTRRACIFFDFDQYLIESLQFATSYQQTQKGLLLRSDDFGDVAVAFAAFKTGSDAPSEPVIITLPGINRPIVVPGPNKPAVKPSNPPKDPVIASFNLKGVYRLEPVSSSLSALILTFDDQYLQFQGCNLHRIPYDAFTNGVFAIPPGGSSTFRQCATNNDEAYLSLIRSADRYTKTEAGFALFAGARLVANLPVRVRNEVVTYKLIDGSYEVRIPGVDATVENGRISFQGCNLNSFGYKLSQDGAIEILQGLSTLKYCDNDVDSIYSQAISSASYVKQTKEGFILVDKSGTEKIRFVSSDKWKSCNNCLEGNFKLQLPNHSVKLSFDNGQGTLSGCNLHRFKVSVSDKGDLIFGGVSSTEKACQVDLDRVFVFSILSAQKLAVYDRVIVFTDGNNKEVARAINYDGGNQKSPEQVKINPASPVVQVVSTVLIPGTYKFNLLRTSFKALPLTIAGNRISFKGCNNVNFSYSATSDGKITFTGGASTRMACPEDYDSFYSSALTSVATFEQMKGQYTFFNKQGKSVITFVLDQPDIAKLVPVTPPAGHY